ncbi:MAG TPA: type II toxin-antitoxin system PemK/MazF family toxin [Pyrinomonadaceae bacterium]|nr:type II toxin-antitoxin system PemK/MazF family toxin [Pyrinomonadaceae bacterium]
MKRGDLYRIYKPTSRDLKRFRVFVVVSRQVAIDSNFSTVICAPIYTHCGDLETQVEVGVKEDLKHDSCVYCDELVSFQKTTLTDFIGSLSQEKLKELNEALKVALAIED